jgi:predicted alpha-1,2-mannosidase
MKIVNLLIFSLLILTLVSCKSNKKKDFTKLVDVFIGTESDGNTFPGASFPFGAIQLSPDTRLDPTAHKAYGYSDSIIYGFSHTHLNGVGEPEYKDILFMPFAGKKGKSIPDNNFFASGFKHENEQAEPGYYSVKLDNQINVALTVTERCGFHKYTFPRNKQQGIFIDLAYPGGAKELFITKVNEFEIEGLRRSHGWAYNQYVYFVARFSKPVTSFQTSVNKKALTDLNHAEGKSIKSIIYFDSQNKDELLVKIGLSAVSTGGARKNLDKEIPDWDFNKIKNRASKAWNNELGKIEIEGRSEELQKIFYTSMYHAFLSPDLYEDVDKQYRGIDGKIHTANAFTNYTVFSIWDTYRALHPLFTIIDQKRTNDFIKSLLAKYDDGGRLPMWPLAGNYTDDMLGYHAVSIIADAYIKGIRNFDTEKAFQAMKEIANMDRLGLKYYKQLAYIPFDRQGESVSKTLEYCYDDWCIAQTAKGMEKMADYNIFNQRAHYYENVFDSTSNLFRGKDINRKWLSPFNPLKNSAYSEGNAYQYLYAPHDIDGLIKLMGGDKNFTDILDTLFNKATDKNKVGGIGQYWHGNEPSHHLAYLYNYAGQGWKTQKIVNQILTELHSDTPDGLAGNEDCGQMSAWYIFSSLGFYPVAPGQDIYVMGAPLFNKAIVHLENGQTFTVVAKNRDDENIYIQSATLNGKNYTKSYIKHSDIMAGGRLVFVMGSTPNKSRAFDISDRPYSGNGEAVVSLPYVKTGDKLFKDFTEISLACDTKNAKIYYTLDGSEPDEKSTLYTKPFKIDKAVVLKMRAYHDSIKNSITLTQKFKKAEYAKAQILKNAKNGLNYQYFERFFVTTADLDKETPKTTGIIDKFRIDEAKRGNYFGYIFKGSILIKTDDIYTFYLNSNDGSRLYINDIELIENDGNHGSIEEVGQIALKAGYHKIKLKYIQCGGGKSLKLSWESSKFAKKEISEKDLFN